MLKTKVLSLEDFDPPPFDESATMGLMNGTPIYSHPSKQLDETQPFHRYLIDYPLVSITSDMFATRETMHQVGTRDLFLPVRNGSMKKILNAWREQGFLEAVHITASEDPKRVGRVLHWIANTLKSTTDAIDCMLHQSDPLSTSDSRSIVDFVTTREWTTSFVRHIAWHPNCIRLAVATRDDRIRIFSQGLFRIPLLKHSFQKSISCMSWRPYTGKELAVGCQSGILVWTIELGAASNSLSHAILLKQRNHAPVTSVSWHPTGNFLVSCSPMDLNMIIWDISKEEGISLRRVEGGGLCFTEWSPCGTRLFVGTCRKVFRVWNTGTPTPWVAEKWTVPNGRVAAACFGPNLTVLFASDENPGTIFSITLREAIFDTKIVLPVNDVKVAIPLIDLTSVAFISEERDGDVTSVGGKIVSMDWDPSGRYLAVLFQEGPWIALIKTNIINLSKSVEVEPCCFIKGYLGELPICMKFHKKLNPTSNDIVYLTIAWSSGRVQHLPLVHEQSKLDNSLLHNWNTTL